MSGLAVAPQSATAPVLFDRVRWSIQSGRVTDGLDDLFCGLKQIRDTLQDDEWRAFAERARQEPIVSDLVFQDPLTRRAFVKPRGYAGDAVMMDYIYGIHSVREAAANASELGRLVLGHLQNSPAVKGVRFRREHIAQLIDQIAEDTPDPTILSIAAGHLREVELSTALRSTRIAKFVALDADAESLREIDRQYGHLGVETVHRSVRHLLAKKGSLGTFDFVYAAGLFDYLSDPVAAALTARMLDLANPGGQILIPNFAPWCRDRAYLETYMAWDLIYRDESDMMRLLERVPRDQIACYSVYRDSCSAIVYLKIAKARSESDSPSACQLSSARQPRIRRMSVGARSSPGCGKTTRRPSGEMSY